MTDRLRSLRRIEAVQIQMVRRAEGRLAAAERACRDNEADKARLRDYVAGEGALGVPLARAALASLQSVDRRLAAAERERMAQRAALDLLRRRERVVATMADAAALAARRAAEDRDLAATMEAWLAGQGASLP